MLMLNVNEERRLTFEIQIGGVQYDQVKSRLVMVVDEMEFGFPARVGRDTVTVDLPPLKKVVGMNLKEGDEVLVKLEMVADGYHLEPWTDKVKISNPLVVEAKIVDDSFVRNKHVLKTNVTLSEDGDETQKTIVKEQERKVEEDKAVAPVKEEKAIAPQPNTDEMLGTLAEKLVSLINKQEGKTEEVLAEDCGKPHGKEVKEQDEEEAEPEEEKVEEKKSLGAIEQLLNDTLKNIRESGSKSKKVTLKDLKENVTEKDIYKYIEKAGTTNKRIQEIIYDQAASQCKKATPFEILRNVVKIMKKK